jgi:asparagine synthase (glutamine-hydrolysing)
LLFDQKNGVLHAVRDRFGIKPLYYNTSSGFCAFASEIKQFESLPNWKPVLVPQVAYDFLAWGLQDHGSDTFFEGVKQLRPGERLEINVEEFTSSDAYQPKPIKWYDTKTVSLSNDWKLEQGAEELRNLLADSVRLRLRSDVPVGSCLSGGLDSSSIVCLIDEERRRKQWSVGQRTFSARAEDAKLDEGRWIDAVLRNRDLTPSFVMPVFEDLTSELSNLVRIQDEPFGSASIFIQNLVFGLAKESGVKVVLDGQGADEILGGYDSFRVCAAAGMLRRGNWLSAIRELHSFRMCSSSTLAWFIQSFECLIPYETSAFIRALLGKKTSGPSWLKFVDYKVKRDNSPAFFGTRSSGVRSLSEVQLNTTSLPKLLHWEDRNSMAKSVEGRVPFLDHRVVEFALGLPDELKVSRGVTKRILREAMRGILPEEIANRKDKIGFAASEREWFLRRNPSWFRAGIEKACEFKGLFSSDLLLRENQKMLEGKRPYDAQMWRVLCFGEWMDRFSVSVP